MSATVCIMDQGTWRGKALWALCPFICHALCTGMFPLKGGFLRHFRVSSQTPAPPCTSSQCLELCTPRQQTWEVWLLPARVRRTPNPWPFSPGSCCQPLPGVLVTRDISLLPLLCAPHTGLVVTWPSASQTKHCNNIKIRSIQQQHMTVVLEGRFSY